MDAVLRESLEPWEQGNDWYLNFDWASLDTVHRAQGGGVRPRYSDPEVMTTLLKYIEDGLPQQDAARLAGIHPSTYFGWKATIPAISEAVKAAEATMKQRMVAHISRAAPTQWAAAMTLLERRFPEDFGKKDRIQHEHAGLVGLQIEPAKMDLEAIDLAAALEERLALADQRLREEQLQLPGHLSTP